MAFCILTRLKSILVAEKYRYTGIHKKPKSKTILITGVSSGIGYETAREFIRRQYLVFGNVRSQADAQRLGSEWGSHFIPLVFDVTDEEAVNRAADTVRSRLPESGLGGLINNAGISVSGPVEHLENDEVAKVFDVNVMGLLRVTKAFLPQLGTNPGHSVQPGRIINISSVMGKISAPYMAPYTGAKHAVEGISNCLRKELLPFGIDVIIVAPGPVRTGIWDKDSLDRFAGTRYISSMQRFFTYVVNNGKRGMKAGDCAKRIADIFEKKNPATRYTMVSNRLRDWSFPLLLPARWVDRTILRRLMQAAGFLFAYIQ